LKRGARILFCVLRGTLEFGFGFGFGFVAVAATLAFEYFTMAWSNFLMTAAVIGGLFYMTKSDVRQGASMFRRNVKTIRSWMEQGEEG